MPPAPDELVIGVPDLLFADPIANPELFVIRIGDELDRLVAFEIEPPPIVLLDYPALSVVTRSRRAASSGPPPRVQLLQFRDGWRVTVSFLFAN
jgi:hypothetical protein